MVLVSEEMRLVTPLILPRVETKLNPAGFWLVAVAIIFILLTITITNSITD